MDTNVSSLEAHVDRRGGYHPCDYETHLALKEFHRILFKDRCRTKRRDCWRAKTVYRCGKEPQCVGTSKDLYAWVLTEYSRSRRPAESPPKELDLPKNWRAQYDEYVSFYAQM